jgi:23S rRNA (cytidine1920-2'-O)/16S rRNA (cytidine1409-2'-O)-methyltransferase
MTAGGGRGQQRLDRELVRRGMARSRSHAQSMIASSGVLVNGRVVTRPAEVVITTDRLVIAARDHYVSRAAHKLLGALDDLGLDVAGRRALDAGASTGGFTQVLLERGCREVIAVDVGTDQLAADLRHDRRVRVWERTNLRDLQLHHVDGLPVEFVVADVSFISLTMILEPLVSVTQTDGRMLLMIKPQFEVGRTALGKSGVVRSAALRQQAVDRVAAAAAALGWPVQAVVASRLPGPAGTIEYFALLCRTSPLAKQTSFAP